MNHHQNALEALAQLSFVAGQIDTAECKDEGLYNRLQSALAVANASLDDAMKALAAAPQVVADEPTDAQMDEWYESASSAHQSLRADRYAFGRACYRAGMEAKKHES